MNWEQIQNECELAHGCSDIAVRSSRHDKRKQKEIEKKQSRVRKVTETLQSYLDKNPYATREQAYSSVISIIGPFLIKWLISAFEKMVLNWLLNRIYTPQSENSDGKN